MSLFKTNIPMASSILSTPDLYEKKTEKQWFPASPANQYWL